MEQRVAGWAAWGLYVVSLALLALTYPMGVEIAPLLNTDTRPLEDVIWSLSWVGFGLVGAVIVQRRPDARIGWLLCGITAGVYAAVFVMNYAAYATLVDPRLPLAVAAIWMAKWALVPVLALVVALAVLFPTGKVQGRWRLWLFRLLLVLFGVQTVLIAFEPNAIMDHPALTNPLGIAAAGEAITALAVACGFALAALTLAFVGDAIVRFRRAAGVERAQFRWFALAVLMFPVLFVLALVVQASPLWQPGDFDTVIIAFVVGVNAIPVAIGVAVTRHGLYEIDRVVSRTVGYVLLTAVLLGIYAGAVVGLSALVRGLTGAETGDLAVAVSTLLVAALFRPLRSRIQRVVDRRFNRARYDAQGIVEAFGQRLRDEVYLSSLVGELEATARVTMEPGSSSVWLREAGATREASA